jgi:multisubunit Na+/H+ antiporter MnhB subunit
MRTALVAVLALLMVGILAPVVVEVADADPGTTLRALVRTHLDASGVEHPVTAVLLNFRAYDTLLEIGVLVVAGITGMSLSRAGARAEPALRSSNTLLHALARWFVPLMLLLAAWLLWAGSHRPGGAFQAGAVLAAAGVLMRLTGLPTAWIAPGPLLRLGLIAGFAVFLLVAAAGALTGRAFLAYPPLLSGPLILLIETLLTLSIGMILLGLYVAAPQRDGEDA